jgi:hypothetical protein
MILRPVCSWQLALGLITTTSGSTSAGTTTTTGTDNGSGTTGATTAGTAGTTGGIDLGGPFVPYDAGPPNEPAIAYDSGCDALFPKFFNNECVQCTSNKDCLPMVAGQDAGVCETNTSAYNYIHHCVECSTNKDCPGGLICNSGTYNQALGAYGTDTCVPDCRGNATICVPGACDGDSGVCLNTRFNIYSFGNQYCYMTLDSGYCLTGSDCTDDAGGGACNPGENPYGYPSGYNPVSYGYGFCVPCTVDGGGCVSPNDFCQQWDNTCYFNQQGQQICNCQNGTAGSCVFNCFFDAGACGPGTYCADAGPVGVDGGNVGGCYPGCQNSSNCGGNTPVCDGGGFCVQCNSSTDCPDWKPGCQYENCGSCATNADCPGSEQCNGNCGCSMDSDCPLDVPTCMNASSNYTGSCACTDGSQCPGGYVCETRGTYAVTNYYTYPYPQGGACIPACASNADCAASFSGTNNTVCNTATGFCVPCTGDTDCTATEDPTKPWVTPSCVLYPDGGNPNAATTLITGGGQCGCTDTSQCNGGYACQSPGYYGSCQPTCSIVNSVDSCTPQYISPYNCPNNYNPGPYCNTFTGGCQQCLDDYDCTGRGYQGNTCNTPFCSDAGTCIGCFTGDDCTFPNNACNNGYCSSYCNDSSQCPTDGGYSCVTSPNGGNACVVTCVLGDDAGMGTVSDAGTPCPTESPLCVPNPYSSDSTMGTCGNCLYYGDTTNCNESMCSCGFGYAYCEAYYCYLYCYC